MEFNGSTGGLTPGREESLLLMSQQKGYAKLFGAEAATLIRYSGPFTANDAAELGDLAPTKE